MHDLREEIALIDITDRLADINRRRIAATVEHHRRIHQAFAGVIVCCLLAGVFIARTVPHYQQQAKISQENVKW